MHEHYGYPTTQRQYRGLRRFFFAFLAALVAFIGILYWLTF